MNATEIDGEGKQIDHSGKLFDQVYSDRKDEVSNLYTVHNIWSDKYDLLIKECITFKYNDGYYIRVRLQHYKRRKIELFLMYFHDSENEFFLPYRTNVTKGEILCDWINVHVNTNGSLHFSYIRFQEHSFIGSDSTYKAVFHEISDEKVKQIEQDSIKKNTKSRSDIGTSEPEQAVYYNVKKFFPDALNRYKLNTEQGDVEADIFIPAIKAAIEYDGKYWHRTKSKVQMDNQKNHIFNDNGIDVIRIRDAGLPELDSFKGKIFIHGKPPEGLHITDIINEVIHFLSAYVSASDKKEQMKSFHLSYEDYLIERPDIEAPLYPEYKEVNFTSDPWFQYWNYEMNGNLDPHNFDNKDSVFAWFTCPKGDNLIRLTKHAENQVINEECNVLNICPFLPHDSYLAYGRDCGNECPFVEERFSKMIAEFILHGKKNKMVNSSTKNELRYYPRTAFAGIEAYLHADEEGKERFNNVFIDVNERTKYRTFLPHKVRIQNTDEAKELFVFIDKNEDLLIIFNWEILDTNEEDRKLLKDQIEKCFETNDITASIKIEHLFSENNAEPSEELASILLPVFNKYHAYFGTESHMALKYKENK